MKSFIFIILSFNCLALSMPAPDCYNCQYDYARKYGPIRNIPLPYQYQNDFQIYQPYYMNNTTWTYNPYPWMHSYGDLRFQNYRYPGMWNAPTRRLNGHAYQGSGEFMAAKPNLYVSGPKDSHFKIELKLRKKSTLLISSPSYANNWSGKIKSNGKLNFADTLYDYIYYDYRFEDHGLQGKAGFCGERKQIVAEMISTLDVLGFKKNEIEDFMTYWPVKLPRANYYCVFPQDNSNINPVIGINVHSGEKEVNIVQMNFLVVLHDKVQRNPSNEKFAGAPPRKWKPYYYSKRDPNQLELREWGVMFMMSSR